MNVVEYFPRQSQWDYSTIHTEPETNSCVSIMAKVILNSVFKFVLKVVDCKFSYNSLDYLHRDKEAFFNLYLYLKYYVGKTLPPFKIYSP